MLCVRKYTVKVFNYDENVQRKLLHIPFNMYIITLADELIANNKCDITINLSIISVVGQPVFLLFFSFGKETFGSSECTHDNFFPSGHLDKNLMKNCFSFIFNV